MKKVIRFDKRAEKEFRKFPRVVRVKAKILFDVLERDGRLEERLSKKDATDTTKGIKENSRTTKNI